MIIIGEFCDACETPFLYGQKTLHFLLLISLSVVCPPDTFIQKTKQRYNSPRSLSTKINLADMQTEIKLRPPYQLSPEDLRAINGFSVHMASKYKGLGLKRAPDSWTLHMQFAESVMFLCSLAAPTQMLEPVTLPGIVSCVLSVLCGGLNLLRGVHAIESVLQVPEIPAHLPFRAPADGWLHSL